MAKLTSCLVVLVAIALAILGPTILQWTQLKADQPFAFMHKHNATVNPAGYHSRLRHTEFDLQDKAFFQWWNFLIFDGQTLDHWTIVYGMLMPRNATPTAEIGLVHLTNTERQVRVGYNQPLADTEFTKPFGINVPNKSDPSQPGLSLKVLSDGEYKIIGSIQSAKDKTSAEWNLVVHRESGYYGGLDMEGDKSCFISSTLFGYHSSASGTIKTVNEKGVANTFNIDRSSRYRVYAAGSWGCHLPTGEPPIDFPWTWFWLIIPGATSSAEDIGLVGGTGRFDLKVGALDGGYYAASLPSHLTPHAEALGATSDQPGRVHLSLRYAKLFHNSSLEMLLQGSASDGYFSYYSVEQENWQMFRDNVGEALLPLRQTFRFASEKHSFVVDFHPTLDQWFRIPVLHDGKVFSDFRAVGVRTKLVIKAKLPGGQEQVVYDQWVKTMNAVEYAYIAPVTDEFVQSLKR